MQRVECVTIRQSISCHQVLHLEHAVQESWLEIDVSGATLVAMSKRRRHPAPKLHDRTYFDNDNITVDGISERV